MFKKYYSLFAAVLRNDTVIGDPLYTICVLRFMALLTLPTTSSPTHV